MTRAKQNITIHLNGNYLDDISSQKLECINDDFQYSPSNLIVSHLSHKDIWLDYFISIQSIIANLKGGDILYANRDGCFDKNGISIIKFSNSYKQKIVEFEKLGFKLSESKVNYIVYWQKEELDNEILIILPELKFRKHNTPRIIY